MSEGENIIADKAYSADKIRKAIVAKGAQPIIPKKKNTIDKKNSGFDRYLDPAVKPRDDRFWELVRVRALIKIFL